MDNAWKAKMRGWLGRHGGVISVERLEQFGCGRRDAYRLVDRGDLRIVMPGVLASSHWPQGREQLMIAACLRSPGHAIGLTSAAELWNFRGVPKADEVHVLVPQGTSPRLPGCVIHRSRRIDPVDLVTRPDGVRLTSPTRTMFDCADVLGARRTASIMEQVINDGRGTLATHVATLARLGRPGRPGTRTMRAVIGSRPAWRAAMESDLEVRVLAEIIRQKLPAPTTQLPLTLPSGRSIRLDFAWADAKVDLEVDHPFWHAGYDESHRDKGRDRLLATVGWQTVRVTDVDVAHALSATIRDVGIVLRHRLPAHFSTPGRT
ncbi:MAG TPA: hypothetical protein VGM78_08940 [Ilumatobacteraceae bacterium]|jgi:hypothetical protein